MTGTRILELQRIFAQGKRSEVVKAGNELIAELANISTKGKKAVTGSTTTNGLVIELPLALAALGEPFMTAWAGFVADRKERRRPMTSRSAKAILNTLSERPERATEGITKATHSNWTGFKWEWLDRNGSNGKHEQSGSRRYF